jgi:hypothetical protein
MSEPQELELAMSEAHQGPGRTLAIGETPEGRVLSCDLALRFCSAAFGLPELSSTEETHITFLEPGWQGRLMADERGPIASSPDQALRCLRDSLQAQAHPDQAHVHPSWLNRARQEESPAVQRALESEAPDRVVDAEISGWIQVLSTERLVGGEPVGLDDPPVIRAMAGLPLRGLFRLVHAIGQAKLALAEGPDDGWPRPQSDRDRHEWYRESLIPQLGGDEPRLRQWAQTELQRSSSSEPDPQRGRAFLGLMTLARLLSVCEPFRARWVLQHLPYSIAKRFRSIMSSSSQISPRIVGIEEVLLKTGWERLTLERRVSLSYPAATKSLSDAP